MSQKNLWKKSGRTKAAGQQVPPQKSANQHPVLASL